MNIWLRRFLGFWPLAGSAIGLGAALPSLLRIQQLALGQQLVLGCTVALFTWGVWCGFSMLEGHPSALRGNRNFWLLQIPILHTPLLSYALFSGAQFKATFNFSSTAFAVDWSLLAARLTVDLGAGRHTWIVGVNVVALLATLYLSSKVKG